MSELSPEDQKLVTLARATRARIGAAEGAAVRDTDGRTYAAATIDLPSLQLSAVQTVVAMAVASGSPRIEACVVLGAAGELTTADAAVLTDVRPGAGIAVHLGEPRGTISDTITL